MISAYLSFAFIAILTIAIPGPTSLLAFSNGARHGLRAASLGVAGAVLSDLVLIAAVSLGLGVLLATSQLLFSAVKWLGVAYLAGLKFGLYQDLKAIASHWHRQQRFEPRMDEAHRRHLYAGWLDAVKRVRSEA